MYSDLRLYCTYLNCRASLSAVLRLNLLHCILYFSSSNDYGSIPWRQESKYLFATSFGTDLFVVAIKLDSTDQTIQHWTLHTGRHVKHPSNIHATRHNHKQRSKITTKPNLHLLHLHYLWSHKPILNLFLEPMDWTIDRTVHRGLTGASVGSETFKDLDFADTLLYSQRCWKYLFSRWKLFVQFYLGLIACTLFLL